jgi:hypothetical protein
VALEQQLLLVGNRKDADKWNTVKVKSGCAECLVLGDSMVRNVGEGKINMGIERFQRIRADQLRGVMEYRKFGCADTVVIHVGTNDFRRSRNLDYGGSKIPRLQFSA